MATYGSKTVTVTTYNQLVFNWKRTSVSELNNSSTIAWDLTLVAGYYGAIYSSAPKAWSVTINGKSYSGTNYVGINAQSSEVLASGTETIRHNTDGSKSFSYSFSQAFDITFDGKQIGTISGSGSATLDSIPRKALITSAPGFNDESNPTITYQNPLQSNATALEACIAKEDGITILVPYRSISKIATTYTFTLTDAERAALRTKTTLTNGVATVRFYIRTTVGSTTYLDYMSSTMRLLNGEPTVTFSVIDVNPMTEAITQDTDILINGYSTAHYTLTAAGVKGATIKETKVIHNGATYTQTEGDIPGVRSALFTYSVTDSRGTIVKGEYTAPFVDYFKPTCAIEAEAPTTGGSSTINIHGKWFNGTMGGMSNLISVAYRYKANSGSYGSWTTVTATRSGNEYYASATVTGLNYLNSYTFQARVVDELETVTSPETTVKTVPIFDWSADDFNFNCDVTMKKDLRLKGSGNYGNTLRFGDGDYCYLTEANDDDLTIKASDLNLDAAVSIKGKPISGSWTPSLGNSGAVSSYSVRQGWYMRLGNVVTIGWQIKATINTGHNGTLLTITGMPFTPAESAFGGGVAHNIYISSVGFNFECWGANTDDTITARLQPCNNTAAGNLNISSSAYYPTGGGQITLAGTICYTTND